MRWPGKRREKTLYILDEPTTGLHFEDVRKLIEVLQALVDQGNTVIVIEHNLEVIKTADFIVDLGPGGGHKGGQIVATGTPEDVAINPKATPENIWRNISSEKSQAEEGRLMPRLVQKDSAKVGNK